MKEFKKTVSNKINVGEKKLKFVSPFENTTYDMSTDITFDDDNNPCVYFTTGYNDTKDYTSTFILNTQQAELLSKLLHEYAIYTSEINNAINYGSEVLLELKRLLEIGYIDKIYVYLIGNNSSCKENEFVHKYNIYPIFKERYKYFPSCDHFNITIYSDMSKYNNDNIRKDLIFKGLIGVEDKYIVPLEFKKCKNRFKKDKELIDKIKKSNLEKCDEFTKTNKLPSKVDVEGNLENFLKDIINKDDNNE